MVMVSIHTIMSTYVDHIHHANHPSSSIVGKCNTSEACEFTGENFRVMLLLGSPKYTIGYRVSVSVGPRLDLGKLQTKSAQDCSENSICLSKSSKTAILRALLEDEVGGVCTKSQPTRKVGLQLEVAKHIVTAARNVVCSWRLLNALCWLREEENLG